MKVVRMKALDITVPLKTNQNFSDDGYVDNIGTHTWDLMKRYEFVRPEVKSPDIFNKDIFGFCFFSKSETVDRKSSESHVHIYYLKTPQPIDILHRAHEETHALHRLGKLKYLFFDMVKNMTNPPLGLLLKNRIEDMADYSGIYAMQKRKLI